MTVREARGVQEGREHLAVPVEEERGGVPSREVHSRDQGLHRGVRPGRRERDIAPLQVTPPGASGERATGPGGLMRASQFASMSVGPGCGGRRRSRLMSRNQFTDYPPLPL